MKTISEVLLEHQLAMNYTLVLHLHLHLGHRRFYPKRLTMKYIRRKIEKQQYVAAGAVKMFIETTARQQAMQSPAGL